MLFDELKNIELKNIQENSEKEINFYLVKISEFSGKKRLEKIIFDYIGNPYSVGPLSIEISNTPSISLFYLDCTVFVLNTAALYLSGNYNDFINNYSRLLYYAGKISYETRIHFTEDRLISHHFFKLVYPSELENCLVSTECNLNMRENGERLININFKKKIFFKSFDYSNEKKTVINNFINGNELLLGIVFLRKNKANNGHIIFHEGFLSGKNIIHAGKNAGKVTLEENFTKYMENAGFDGFALFDIGDSSFEN